MGNLSRLQSVVVRGGASKWGTFMKYARVELAPPSPKDIPAISKGFSNLAVAFKTQKWKDLTVKQAWLNALVGIEISLWFFAGEIIGRRHWTGYYVAPE